MTEQYGYTGKILRVDLSAGKITTTPTADYASFIGGRGIASKIYWDEVSPDTRALDPENRLLFFTGPVGGFPAALAASRWQVCSKSPATDREYFCNSNSGGHWGAQLKFAGYDGLIIQGKSDKPVYLLIQDDKVEIRDASPLWGKGARQVRYTLKAELGDSVKVIATGPAGDNLVAFANVLADNDASASGGFGAVMGSKNLKAIAVRGSGSVKAAHPERLRELSQHIRKLKEGKEPPDPHSHGIRLASARRARMKQDICYGCHVDWCGRWAAKAPDGTWGKSMCQPGHFYIERARRYYGKEQDATEEMQEMHFRINLLVNDYGMDSHSIEVIMMWLNRCRQAGILTDEDAGFALSTIGSQEYIETLMRKIALREGLGDVLAQGLHKAAQTVGKGSDKLITDYVLNAGQIATHEGRIYITTGLLYAMEPRQPTAQIHEISRAVGTWDRWADKQEGCYLSSEVFRAIAKRFWGSEVAGDFSTYEGKALAAIKIQDREYAKESLGLCDFVYPLMYSINSEDYLGDSTLESQLFSAVTGKEVDEEGLSRFGARIFNLQRAILAREGHRGREYDQLPETFFTKPLSNGSSSLWTNPKALVPGKNGEPISRIGLAVDREQFEQMKTEYYQLRGWDKATGLQRRANLEDLGLADVADKMAKEGLLAPS